MRNNHTSDQSDEKVFRTMIDFNFADKSFRNYSTIFFNIAARNLGSGSRIRSRRVSGSQTGTALMKSAEFTRVDSAMLRSRWSNSSPTRSTSQMTLDVQDILCVDAGNISPVQNCRTEWISNCNSSIGKKQRGSLDSKGNCRSKHQSSTSHSKIFGCHVGRIDNCGQEHTYAEEVSESAVNLGAMRTKNNWIAARASQKVER